MTTPTRPHTVLSTSTSYSEAGDWIINNTYKLFVREMLGSGSFGEIYRGINLITREEVAVKIERDTAPQPQLAMEAKLYQLLRSCLGFPKLYYYGEENGYRCLVMELLGPSIEEVYARCGRIFCLKTVLMLADQAITRLEQLHSKAYVHRDIKPDNFVLGRYRRETIVHMIDLGLAKRYCDPKTNVHLPYRDKKGITGTVRYASINTHRGIEQSRRDDMESLGYMLVYLMRGHLPWQGVRAQTRKLKYIRIGDVKMQTTADELCKYCPEEFSAYINYVKSLSYESKPDYQFCRDLFLSLMMKEGYITDSVFEWSGGGVITLPHTAVPPGFCKPFKPSAAEKERMQLRMAEREKAREKQRAERERERLRMEAYLRVHPNSETAKKALEALRRPSYDEFGMPLAMTRTRSGQMTGSRGDKMERGSRGERIMRRKEKESGGGGSRASDLDGRGRRRRSRTRMSMDGESDGRGSAKREREREREYEEGMYDDRMGNMGAVGMANEVGSIHSAAAARSVRSLADEENRRLMGLPVTGGGPGARGGKCIIQDSSALGNALVDVDSEEMLSLLESVATDAAIASGASVFRDLFGGGMDTTLTHSDAVTFSDQNTILTSLTDATQTHSSRTQGSTLLTGSSAPAATIVTQSPTPRSFLRIVTPHSDQYSSPATAMQVASSPGSLAPGIKTPTPNAYVKLALPPLSSAVGVSHSSGSQQHVGGALPGGILPLSTSSGVSDRVVEEIVAAGGISSGDSHGTSDLMGIGGDSHDGAGDSTMSGTTIDQITGTAAITGPRAANGMGMLAAVDSTAMISGALASVDGEREREQSDRMERELVETAKLLVIGDKASAKEKGIISSSGGLYYQ
ncbi:putative Casein kinase [Monocercomonoides exilis]|uniref:putative Casein kinase n=1 Tax=Monocercomonoides exilis TaxID=2049356 RepID=UPI00355A29B7|nr:putative Casein kinase [Monocercomonoides exilis]|eukprot:MONOS_8246.1-p1 / transcript=MONOS_8246.1 / gene=MONOS_8246 / organism=Monocercomonoides_exilis_PA203 / gene_product=Casein kinase / transcript_product=Casein kinase / location=Mono_scaffold00306:25541-28283(+) / protein_length=857 / sequence_SO=supercontig / SO=protein_coding / is_pseudo=false